MSKLPIRAIGDMGNNRSMINIERSYQLVSEIKRIFNISSTTQNTDVSQSNDRKEKWSQVIDFLEQNPSIMLELMPQTPEEISKPVAMS